jgi:HEAT repeat protein
VAHLLRQFYCFLALNRLLLFGLTGAKRMAWLRAGLILLILPALVCANGFPHFAISREQLLSLLNSPDPQQRLSAATSLGIRRDVEAVGTLLEVVERPDEIEAVKVEAVEALGMLRGTGVMPRLLDHLSHEPAPRVRSQIVDLLGELGGEQAWSVLRTLLQTDPSPTVRGQVAVALGRLRDPGARAVLEARLRDEPETHTRLALLQGLGLLGDPAALPTVLSLFSTATEPLLRQGAAHTIGMLGDHRGAAPLVAALQEPSVSPDLRQAIAIALGQLRDPAAIPALAGLLDDSDPVTVVLGIRGLGEMEHSAAATPLLALGRRVAQTVAALARRGAQHNFARHLTLLRLQREIIHALGRLREPRAWPLLEQALITPAPAPTSVEALRLRDQQYELRRTALMALVHMPDSLKVRRWLERLLKDRDPKVRAEATRALGMRADTHNVILLRPAFHDAHPEVRWEAIRAVGVMQARSAGTAVLQALHDPHPRVVAEAARACAALRETQAIPRLETLLHSTHDEVVQEAVAAALDALRR